MAHDVPTKQTIQGWDEPQRCTVLEESLPYDGIALEVRNPE